MHRKVSWIQMTWRIEPKAQSGLKIPDHPNIKLKESCLLESWWATSTHGCTVHRYFLPSYSSICDRKAPQVDEAHDLLCGTGVPPSYLIVTVRDCLVQATWSRFSTPSPRLLLPSCKDHGDSSGDKELWKCWLCTASKVAMSYLY